MQLAARIVFNDGNSQPQAHMNTTARSILSATAGLSLATFTAVSLFTVGLAAPLTVLGVCALAICGLIEIASLDYTPVTVRRIRVAATHRVEASKSVVVPFEPATGLHKAA
jgi:hypothetical protein